MTNLDNYQHIDDRYNLNRFLQAQETCYLQALAEIKNGRKQSHWMWYIFPQFDAPGLSPRSSHYSIKSIEEATAYLAHPVLGPRLLECAEAVVEVEGRTANDIFDSPDDMKLKSCATLFVQVASPDSVFERLLEKYFEAEPDSKTLELLGMSTEVEIEEA